MTHTVRARESNMQQRLVVSCQPLPGSAMDRPEIILAMALAAVDGGASVLRIQGIDNVRRIVPYVPVPVIGWVERSVPDSDVRITPWLDDVDALVDAGALIIAFDATQRRRPVPVAALLQRIQTQGALAMADCSNLADGLAAWSLGVDLVSTTLSPDLTHDPVPDLALIRQLSSHGCRVVAQGRIRTPQQAAEAMEAGARLVTVGSAITRIEHITGRFRDAMRARAAP